MSSDEDARARLAELMQDWTKPKSYELDAMAQLFGYPDFPHVLNSNSDMVAPIIGAAIAAKQVESLQKIRSEMSKLRFSLGELLKNSSGSTDQ